MPLTVPVVGLLRHGNRFTAAGGLGGFKRCGPLVGESDLPVDGLQEDRPAGCTYELHFAPVRDGLAVP